MFLLLLCLSFFSNRVSRSEKAFSVHHCYIVTTNYTIFWRAKKKYKEGKNSKKYTRYSVEQIKLDHQHHTNKEYYVYTAFKEIHHWLQSGTGKRGWLSWKLLFVQLSYRVEIKTRNVEVFLWSTVEPRLLVSNLTLS